MPQWLDFIRSLPLGALQDFVKLNITPTLSLANDYIESLDENDKTIAIRASALVFVASNKRIVPREYQLQSVLALAHGRDCVVDSGTGSGKTLCQIIPNLLFPDTTSVTVSPLKRLQILQAAEFVRWGIKTVCINEDTPRDAELWKNIKDGHFQHLIVQPEQLGMYQGHLPRLAGLLNVSSFVKTLARVHVDEAHNHHAAGLPHYGLPAFRPAWGRLNEFRLRLRPHTPFEVLSGTFPPHVKTAIIQHLNFDPTSFVSLKLSSNRPNIVYATHRIVGSLSDFRNLDFLIAEPFTLKCLIFHDNTQQCSDAALYHESKLPQHLSKSGFVRHYHSGMSKDYLTQVFDDFSNENGECKLLHATEGVSTGLDVGGIDAVIDYGVPQKHNDPDRPLAGHLIKNAKKPARTGLAMILYVREEDCLRRNITNYLADASPTALSIDKWCCDRPHLENPAIHFDKRSFFPGRFIYEDENGAIYAGDVDENDRVHLNSAKKRKHNSKSTPNRKVADRDPLQTALRSWVSTAHASDRLRAVRPASFILDPKAIKALAAVHPDRMKTVEHVAAAVEETNEWKTEWAEPILSIILEFDAALRRLNPPPPQ
ncbi:P-loop containing nucleoside triphosphate hydrolase protein [Mycena olivaceomarginata]|nr:P-loop containing nucleoside triphosphate hydrolase protein [Mycena olivaceomarginata]